MPFYHDKNQESKASQLPKRQQIFSSVSYCLRLTATPERFYELLAFVLATENPIAQFTDWTFHERNMILNDLCLQDYNLLTVH